MSILQLRGWDYTGRNIGPELHTQYYCFVRTLSDNAFVNHRSWGTDVQEDVAKVLGVSSSGAIRTIKKMFEMLGFLAPDALSSRSEITRESLLTQLGETMFAITKLEHELNNNTSIAENDRKAASKEIKKLYEEVYCDALRQYYYTNKDGTHLCPLRATLIALAKYGKLDKWEWYMLNTYVRHDDDTEDYKKFFSSVDEYRREQPTLSMANVIEKPKGHQYIPQYFEYAGLVQVVQRPEWIISSSSKHNDVKQVVLSADYLDKLYGRRD